MRVWESVARALGVSELREGVADLRREVVGLRVEAEEARCENADTWVAAGEAVCKIGESLVGITKAIELVYDQCQELRREVDRLRVVEAAAVVASQRTREATVAMAGEITAGIVELREAVALADFTRVAAVVGAMEGAVSSVRTLHELVNAHWPVRILPQVGKGA